MALRVTRFLAGDDQHWIRRRTLRHSHLNRLWTLGWRIWRGGSPGVSPPEVEQF